MPKSAPKTVEVNRAPVLTLWAAIVAQRLGFDEDEALTLGQALAGMVAHAKAVRIGLYEPDPKSLRDKKAQTKPDETVHVALMTRAIPVLATARGGAQLAKRSRATPPRYGSIWPPGSAMRSTQCAKR